MTLFDGPAPRWFTIPAHRPFVEDLAKGLLDAFEGAGPEALSQAIILLPNRRAARALAHAFATARANAPVLLPQIRPLGDLEENEPPFEPGELMLDLPPAITPLARRFELARLVAAHDPLSADSPVRALEMADALAAFLDSVQIEEVQELDRIETLTHADMAEHWRASAAFLSVAVREWPRRLRELGLIDVADRRVRLLDRLAEAWDQRPPSQPLIAAGSTGTVPAARRVLGAVARAPQGCVVLPGLDLDLAESAWTEVDHQHPHGAMKRLLQDQGASREQVRLWPGRESARDRARRRLVAEALKPPAATKDWRGVIDALAEERENPIALGMQGLTSVAARTEEQAAAVAAVLMREVLETPDKTCALITPDPLFARRVQARLSRWGLQADSSAGDPLALTPAGMLLGLMADLVGEPFAAVPLLAVLKHPSVGLGYEAQALRRAMRALERHGLRGPRPQGWAAIVAALQEQRTTRDGGSRSEGTLAAIDAAEALLDRLREALEPWTALFANGPVAPDAAARRLAETLETLARDDARALPLWGGADGAAAARLIADLMAAGAALGPVSGRDFARLLRDLLEREPVRTGGDTHPRLRILGAIEARLLRADRMILAGVEEGVWPRAAPTDPFLSRPMRETLKLPPPERRIGLSAHDFAQGACAPEVYLLHTERRGGQPSVKSRWLWRLETLVSGAGLKLPERPELIALAAALDRAPAEPPASLAPAARPSPKPPVETRPRAMSVTRVEEWVRDPYATYARFILKLDALSRPDERIDARLRGTAIHHALEQFSVAWPNLDPRTASQTFVRLYLDALRSGGMPEPALARETALAQNAGEWACRFETQRRARGARVLIEQRGELPIPAAREPFRLSARADRLEVRDGAISVIDFKTGGAPSKKQVETGFSPQLSLTAAIASHGGFPELGRLRPDELLYVSVTGRRPPAREEDRSGDAGAEATAALALEGLVRKIEQFEDPQRGYGSRTAPQFAQRSISDYDHLARVREWSVAGEEEAE